MRHISQIILSLALLTFIPVEAKADASDLCKDGVLLFREDFGGNDTSDPRICQTPVQGMTYQQLMTDYFGVMNQGR